MLWLLRIQNVATSNFSAASCSRSYHFVIAGEDNAVEAALDRTDVPRAKLSELVHPRHASQVIYLKLGIIIINRFD